MILKFLWRDKRSRMVNIMLKEKCKVGGLMLPYFKTYYKTRGIKMAISKKIDKQINR